jgi:hypothetical protein
MRTIPGTGMTGFAASRCIEIAFPLRTRGDGILHTNGRRCLLYGAPRFRVQRASRCIEIAFPLRTRGDGILHTNGRRCSLYGAPRFRVQREGPGVANLFPLEKNGPPGRGLRWRRTTLSSNAPPLPHIRPVERGRFRRARRGVVVGRIFNAAASPVGTPWIPIPPFSRTNFTLPLLSCRCLT